MKGVELQISHDELLLLVNELSMAGIESVQISYPFFGIDLMTLNPYELTINDVVSFDRYVDATQQVDPLLEKEIPGFSELKHALLSSGVMEMGGWDDAKKELLRISAEPRDVHIARRKTYISVDTNILYFRVLSRKMHTSPGLCVHHGVLDPSELSWVVSDVVVNEIDRRIKSKYRKEHIAGFKKLKSGYLAERFMNMSTLSTRTSKCAFLDLNYLLGELGALRLRCKEFPQDKEERDILIAKTLRMFEEEKDCDIFLLSADEDMLFHARDNGLSCHVLHVPHVTVDWARLTPEACAHLIRDLAVTYGCISLKGTGIVIYGEWTGMTSSNWMNEDIMLWVEEGARILQPLKTSLTISRSIRERFPEEMRA